MTDRCAAGVLALCLVVALTGIAALPGGALAGSGAALVDQSRDGSTSAPTPTPVSVADARPQQQQPTFAVSIQSHNSPVVAGETFSVKATVTNTGNTSGTQTVELFIQEGLIPDSTSVSLDPGDSKTVTLTWNTGTNDAGQYSPIVSSETDGVGFDLTVQEPAPASFQVSITGTNSPVLEGEPLSVSVSVTNTGDETGTKQVTLSVGDVQRDSTTLTLAGGESQSVTLSWVDASPDGTYVAGVSSPDDFAQEEVVVQEPAPASYAVAIDSTNAPVVAGGTVDVTATVTNTGDQAGEKSVSLAVGGRTRDSRTLSLAGGESTSVTFSWATGVGDAGEYTARVASPEEADTRSVTVLEPASFDVRITGPPDDVRAGGTVSVQVKVTNTGEVPDSQSVTLAIAGTERDSAEVALDGGGSRTLALSWPTGSDDVGEFTATVASEDDTARTTVRVLEPLAPANFDVEVDFTSAPVLAGEDLIVVGIVRNTGEESATQELTFLVDGDPVDTARVTLEGGDSAQVSFEWPTGPGDVGDHTITLESDDDSATADAAVQAETTATPTPSATTTRPPPDDARFGVSIDATTSPVVGGTPLTVTATVTNRGGVAGEVDVGLVLDGGQQDSRSLSLDAGASRTINLTWSTDSAGVGDFTATVAAGADQATAPVAVRGPDASTFDVEIDSTTPPAAAGEPLTVRATVTNTGAAMDTQVVTLTVDGSERGSKQVTLAGGASATLEYTWSPEGELGDATLEVASEDDDDSAALAGAGGGGNPLANPVLLGLLLLVAALGGGGYYYVRRQ